MKPRKSEEGQSIILAVLCMTAILGFVGLATDVGVLRTDRILLQTVADSAAIAGAAEVKFNDVTTAAQTDAMKNGFVLGASAAALVVNNPPLGGPHTGDSNYVEVIATESKPTMFMSLFGMSSVIIKARAVAGLGSGGSCIIALNPTATQAISVTGSGGVQANCGVVDDSNSSTAFKMTGSGTFAPQSTAIVGNYSKTGTATITPTPMTGVVPVSDPLSYLPKPGVGACTYTNFSVSGTGNYTMNPGVYCNGLGMSGGYTATFNAGTYIINGGTLSINGSGTATGNGVFFYLTNNAKLAMTGSGTLNVVAPTSGSYAGVLVFQDPADTTAGSVTGSTNAVITGAIYLPKAALTFTGSGSTASAYTLLVADTITMTGTTHFNGNYSTLPNGSPIKAAHLTE